MLENPRSPRVRAVAKLAKKTARAESGMFLLEGPQAVAEALTFRPQLVVELYATPSALERYADIAEAAADGGEGRVRGIPPARRHPRGGPRPGQRRHDRASSGCRRRRRRGVHRPCRR